MLSVDEARDRILALARMTDPEQVPLAEAAGRVPASWSFTAAADVPPFANSAMDGFAVRAADRGTTLTARRSRARNVGTWQYDDTHFRKNIEPRLVRDLARDLRRQQL